MFRQLTSIPLDIRQAFNPKLLSMPMPRLCDSSETLWTIYQYIKGKLWHKRQQKDPDFKKRMALEAKFLELYERAKAKERQIEAKTGARCPGSLYWFASVDRKSDEAFARLRDMAVYFESNKYWGCG